MLAPVKRTLITGVGGFTGPFLAQLLATQGHEVHGLVQSERDEASLPGVTALHCADLADLQSIQTVVDRVRPTHVAHLAGIAFVGHDDVAEMYRSNVLGTRQLLQALSIAKVQPRSVLLASSANVYGNARAGVLEEDLQLSPANDYGATKVAMEYVAIVYGARLPIIVARPFNYTGRGQSAAFLIPKIVDHIVRRAEFIQLGNLEVARDFSDVRVVIDAYARLLAEPSAIGGTFNICSGKPRTLNEVVELAQRVGGHRLEVKVDPAFVRANEVRRLAGSAARLEAQIGPLKQIPLEETLRWMLEP